MKARFFVVALVVVLSGFGWNAMSETVAPQTGVSSNSANHTQNLPNPSQAFVNKQAGPTFGDTFRPVVDPCVPGQGAQSFNSALGLGLGY